MIGNALEAKEDRSLKVKKKRRAKGISFYVAFDLSIEAVRVFRNMMSFIEAFVYSFAVLCMCALYYTSLSCLLSTVFPGSSIFSHPFHYQIVPSCSC